MNEGRREGEGDVKENCYCYYYCCYYYYCYYRVTIIKIFLWTWYCAECFTCVSVFNSYYTMR